MFKKIIVFVEWLLDNTLGNKRLKSHLTEFPYILVLLIGLFVIAWFVSPSNWIFSTKLIGIALALLTALLIIRPMNAVYGLMGTSGSIRLFFINFLFITILFAGVYYRAFFKDAGISYDINQPHIDYSIFADNNENNAIKVSEIRDTMLFEHQIDTIHFCESVIHVTKDTIHYQPIDFWQVWRSSVLTTLTQEPADLLATATIHNSAMDSTNVTIDKHKSSIFEWILIFHTIISWLFFGVFISLLYNKFRHES